MKYLLFEGSSNVGKTTAINRFAHNLISKYSYNCVVGNLPPVGSKKDFQIVLENKNSNNGKKRVMVNSASDSTDIIDSAKVFCNSNTPYDVIVSSCREEVNLYNHFFTVFSISPNDKLFELPMAKINHRNPTLKAHGMKWFKDKVDILADYLFQRL